MLPHNTEPLCLAASLLSGHPLVYGEGRKGDPWAFFTEQAEDLVLGPKLQILQIGPRGQIQPPGQPPGVVFGVYFDN